MLQVFVLKRGKKTENKKKRQEKNRDWTQQRGEQTIKNYIKRRGKGTEGGLRLALLGSPRKEEYISIHKKYVGQKNFLGLRN